MLFTFVGGRGHLEPMLPIARAASAGGHVVAFAGQPAVVDDLRSGGVDTFAVGPVTLHATKQPLVAPDAEREDRVLRDHFAGTFARARAVDLAAVIERWRPDVVVCDEGDFGAMVAAERLDVRRAVVLVTAAGTFVRPELVAEPLHRLRVEHGLAPDRELSMLHRDLVLAPLPPSFRDGALPVTARAIRPAALDAAPSGRPVHAPASSPIVYATLGTIFNLESGDLFARIVTGLRHLPIGLVVTVGGSIDPGELGPQPANVHIEAFIPQAALLPRCAAVVCHGGSGTVIGALAHGLPLVVLPMGADQPHNAARCADLGVGTTLDVMTATPAEIGAAVTAVLTDGSYRRRAGVLQRECESLPDAHHVVRLLERLATTG